jgi:putative ABC transport system permease protein
MLNDLCFAFRQWRKHPASTVLAALILALGIGGSTAVFSVADKVLLRPIPGRENQHLLTVNELDRRNGLPWPVSPPLLRELLSHSNLLQALTFFDQSSVARQLQSNEKTVKLWGTQVAPNFFEFFGLRPQTGRSFLAEEGTPASQLVIVVSHGLWQQQFGSAPDVVGRTLLLDGKTYTVVGIMPPNVQFPFGPGRSQFWIPFAFSAEELNRRWEPEDARAQVVGRLREGVAMEELQAVLDPVAARWQQDLGQPAKRWKFAVGPWWELQGSKLARTLWSLQAMVGVLLLIGCANVGNLLLSRALARRGEFGVRLALGASRWRVARQLLVESLALAGVAAALGVFFAWGGILMLERFYLSQLPRIGWIGVDWRVLGTACLLSVAAGLLFGAAPAWLAARSSVQQSLQETAPQHTGGFLQRVFHDGLVVVQVSLAVLLLAGAGMMVHSVVNLLRVDPGLNPRGLYCVQYDPNPVDHQGYDRAATTRRGLSGQEARTESYRWRVRQHVSWQEMALERLQAIPGIEAAAVFSRPGPGEDCQIEGREDLVRVGKGTISVRTGDFFRTAGVPLISGRLLTKADGVPGEPAVVVNECLARTCWPGQNPLGKRLRPASPSHGTRAETERVVVGVVKNMEELFRDAEIKPVFYEPYERMAPEGETGLFFNIGEYLIRSRLDLEALRESLLRLGKEMSPAVDLWEVSSVDAQLYASTAPRRVMMWLLTTLGGLGLLMSALGVYAVMAYAVVCRTREVGIRMALGADRTQIQRQFLLQGVRLTVNGLALGVVVALLAARYLESLLFGVSAADPWAFTGILLILGLAVGVACWLPARRAAKIDPMEALRCE